MKGSERQTAEFPVYGGVPELDETGYSRLGTDLASHRSTIYSVRCKAIWCCSPEAEDVVNSVASVAAAVPSIDIRLLSETPHSEKVDALMRKSKSCLDRN